MERTLFIGVGGSGGETVRYVMRELDRRLRSAGWTEGLPTAWQFVHIDVRQKPDDVKSSIPVALSNRLVHLGLGSFPLEFDHYAGKLKDNPGILPGLAGWLPAADSSQSPPYTGAGQRRAVGRAVAAAELQAISDLIENVSQQMSTGDADEQLKRLASCINSRVDVGASNGLVFVVSSLGGGAGSGAFLDVIQLLRAQSGNAVWLARPYAALYAPDVFNGLPDGAGRGIEANSLAAISELMNAYVHTGPMRPADAAVLQAAGGGIALSNRLGPEAALIIGSSSGASGVTFANPTEIYEAVGKAMAALIGSDSVASQFDAYVRSNFGVASPALKLPFSLQGQPNPISSLGYASVSLGKELFATYASERLATATLTRLREGYYEGHDRSVFARVETLIEDRAQSQKNDFFLQSGLWEVGKEHDQVLDALRDAKAKSAALDALGAGVLKKAVTRVEMSVDEWIQRISTAFDADAKEVEKKEVEDRNARAARWIVDVQDQLLTATVESVARNGFDVTMRLLDLLASQVEDAERGLDLERQTFGKRESVTLENIGQHFSDLKARVRAKLRGDAGNEKFKAVVKTRRDAFSDRTEGDLRKLAQDLLADVRVRLIPPVKAVVDAMSTSLAEDLNVPEVRQLVAQWSNVEVSKHLQPTPNEILLTPATEFPKTFDEIMVAMFETRIKDAVGEALEEIIRGGWASEMEVNGGPQSLVSVEGQWQPDVSVVRETGSPVRPASFSSLLSADRIYEMSSSWVRGRRGVLSEYIGESLGEWLVASPAELKKRGDKFRTSLASALTRAAPLASFDDDICQKVHGQRMGKPNILISAIPMESNHPSYAAVQKVLGGAVASPAQVAQCFGVTSEDAVEIVSFPAGTVHPVVVSSLTGAIQNEWVARRTDKSSASDFWEYRRARPLASYVPLPPELLRTMLQGWFVAQVLGQVDYAGDAVTVWTPDGKRTFPGALKTSSNADAATLPALLESYSLALLAYASDHAGELDAYNELIRVGLETSGAADLVPSVTAAGYLSQWVREGTAATGAPQPDPDFAGPAGGTPAERAAAIIAALEVVVGDYEALTGHGAYDPRAEIREAYLEALHGVKDKVSALAVMTSAKKTLK